eukprot:7206302-Prymnesium_polylepis.2
MASMRNMPHSPLGAPQDKVSGSSSTRCQCTCSRSRQLGYHCGSLQRPVNSHEAGLARGRPSAEARRHLTTAQGIGPWVRTFQSDQPRAQESRRAMALSGASISLAQRCERACTVEGGRRIPPSAASTIAASSDISHGSGPPSPEQKCVQSAWDRRAVRAQYGQSVAAEGRLDGGVVHPGCVCVALAHLGDVTTVTAIQNTPLIRRVLEMLRTRLSPPQLRQLRGVFLPHRHGALDKGGESRQRLGLGGSMNSSIPQDNVRRLEAVAQQTRTGAREQVRIRVRQLVRGSHPAEQDCVLVSSAAHLELTST